MIKQILFFLLSAIPCVLFAQLDNGISKVKITNGIIEGVPSSGISIFKGIPFAQPPIGDLRWKAPQPIKNWDGIYKADHFGYNAMQKNIGAFGGDPKRVTIAGESAGSISVSALMASPLSKNMIAGAIGESGAMINPTMSPVTLSESEQSGLKFAKIIGVSSLADLRAIPAEKLLDESTKKGMPHFSPNVDGYFLPKLPVEIFTAGEQANVPLLVGWNSEENNYKSIMGSNELTPEGYLKALQTLYGNKANEALKYFPGSNKEEVFKSATALAGYRFIAFSTWKWFNLCLKTGNSPVYRYYFERPRPAMRPKIGNDVTVHAGQTISGITANKSKSLIPAGAVHSAEIEYAMGNLPTNRVFDWQPEDYKVSAIMQEFFANFIKTGNPNGLGLPEWPAANIGNNVQVMHINVKTSAKEDKSKDSYIWLDEQFNLKR